MYIYVITRLHTLNLHNVICQSCINKSGRKNKTMRYHLIPVRMAVIKKTKDNKCWQECGESKLLCTVGGNVNWYRHYGKQYGVSSKN